MKEKLLAFYGLKYPPFLGDIPVDAFYIYPALENFLWRIQHHFVQEGGFALISGESGTGKSITLRLLSNRLEGIRDVKLGIITHPSARLSDFYRELGDVFGVSLSVHNRWHSFKTLRERWWQHIENSLFRLVLFIDEAQEMPASVLNELRLLTSAKLDSRSLLSVIFAGDERFNEKLRREELIPLGSRIRFRFKIESSSVQQLSQSLQHLLVCAGNPNLMSQELIQVLCEHALGNYRVLCTMANELLVAALKQEKMQLDEKLFFDCFSTPTPTTKRKS